MRRATARFVVAILAIVGLVCICDDSAGWLQFVTAKVIGIIFVAGACRLGYELRDIDPDDDIDREGDEVW